MRFLQTEDGQLLADTLLQVGAVQFGEFLSRRCVEDPRCVPSPFYFRLGEDLEDLPQKRYVCKAVGIVFSMLAHDLQLPSQIVCGVPSAGSSLAVGFAHVRVNPPQMMDLVRINGSTTFEFIESIRPYGLCAHNVLMLDDVLSGSTLQRAAIEAVRAHGYEVTDLLTVVDREDGAQQRLSHIGVRGHAIFGMNELIAHYHAGEQIESQTFARVQEYLTQF